MSLPGIDGTKMDVQLGNPEDYYKDYVQQQYRDYSGLNSAEEQIVAHYDYMDTHITPQRDSEIFMMAHAEGFDVSKMRQDYDLEQIQHQKDEEAYSKII